MRIVLTTNFSPWSPYSGGGQRSTHFLAQALAARGHDVHVVFTKPPWQKVHTPALPYRVHWAALWDRKGARSAPLRPLTAFSVARQARALTRGRSDCVVHAQGEEGALIARAVDCPFVLTARYPHFPWAALPPPHSIAWLRSWLLDTKYRALGVATRSADLVVTTSRAAAQALRTVFRLDGRRIRVVPNGVDPAFLACARAPDAGRGPVLFFGRLERDKGVELLLDAFGRAALPGRALHFLGEGSAAALLRERRERREWAGRLQLSPWQSSAQLAAALARAALAVLPSEHESFGNTMLEAMAAGLPLITSDIPALRETTADGTCALLVPPRDENALASAMRSLIAAPERAEAMGRAARAHVRAHYSWDAVAAQYEALYREVRAARRDRASSPAPSAASG